MLIFQIFSIFLILSTAEFTNKLVAKLSLRASSNNLRQEAAGNAANSVDLIRRNAIEHDSFVDKVLHHNSEDFRQVRSAHQLLDDLFARIRHVTSVHDVFVESRQILVELAVVAEAAHFGVNRCKSVK